MPLTDAQRKVLEELGHIDKAPEPKTGFTEAVSISAGRALPSTAGALGAAGLAARAHPLLAIPAAIAGGIGGEALFSKAGEVLFPEELKSMDKATAQARKEQAAGSFIGEVLPSLVSLKPSPSMVAKAGKGLRGLLTRKAPTAAQKAAMVESGLGAGIDTGVELSQQLLSGEDMNIPRLGLAALTGSTLTPNKLGQKLFNMGSVPDVKIESPPNTVNTPTQLVADNLLSTKVAENQRVLMTDKAGNVTEAIPIKNPTGIEIVERNVLTPERIKQAESLQKAKNKAEKALSTFNKLELAAMDDAYATELKSSYDAALERLREDKTEVKTSVESLGLLKKYIAEGSYDPTELDIKLGAKMTDVGDKKPSQIVADIIRAQYEPVATNQALANKAATSPVEQSNTFYSFPANIAGKMLTAIPDKVGEWTESVSTTLRKTKLPANVYLADALDAFTTDARRYFGRFYGDTTRRLLPYSRREINKAWAHLNELNDTGKSNIKLTQYEQEALDIIRESLRDPRQVQNDLGLPVKQGQGSNQVYRAGNFNPNYAPNKPNKVYIQKFLEGLDDAEYKAEADKFANWHVQRGLSRQQALNDFDALYKSVRSTTQSESTVVGSFGPLDKAEGIGLPPYMRDNDFNSVMKSYSHRAAKRLAWFDKVERHNWARHLLNIEKDPVTGKPTDKFSLLPDGFTTADEASKQFSAQPVKQFIDSIEGRYLRSGGGTGVETTTRLLKAFAMGITTGARDLVTATSMGWQHMLPSQIPSFTARYIASALKVPTGRALQIIAKNMRLLGAKTWPHYLSLRADDFLKDWTTSIKKGVNLLHVANFEQLDALGQGFEQKIERLADGVNMISGRSMVEQASRAGLLVGGRFMLADMVNRLHKNKFIPGEKLQAERQLEFFAGKAKAREFKRRGLAALSSDELDEMAAKFVESVQGTYDEQNLTPSLTNGGAISSMFSLLRWSTEKFNNYNKHVINEAREGNWVPFINHIGHLIIGGAAVNQISQAITGKEPRYVELDELKQASEQTQLDMDELAYTLLGYAEISGYAGILGSALFRLASATQGTSTNEKFLNAFALDQSQEIAGEFADLLAAVSDSNLEGAEKARLVTSGVSKLLINRWQTIRVAKDRLQALYDPNVATQQRIKNYQITAEKANYLFDYSNLGNTYGSPSVRGMFEKEFKNAQTVDAAVEALKPAIKSVVRRTTGSGQSPQALKDALSNLNGPAPASLLPGGIEQDPARSAQFLEFVEGTKGEEAQKQLLRDFLRLKQMNELKRSIVPKP